MQEASRLLTTYPRAKIAEIAELAGFAGAGNFFRTFRRFFGLSPQAHRARVAQSGLERSPPAARTPTIMAMTGTFGSCPPTGQNSPPVVEASPFE
jgi:hypothetical protein